MRRRRRETCDRAVDGRRAVIALLALVLVLFGCGTSPDGPVPAPTSPDRTPSVAPPSAPAAPTEDPAAPGNALRGVRVAIDPGHNRDNGAHAEAQRMVDAGGFLKQCNTTGTATADGYPESRFTWELAGVLADRLRAAGAETVLTRDADAGWGPCIDDRGRFAAESGADLLVSLHADGSDVPGHAGFHVISPTAVPGWTDDIAEPSAALARAVRDALVDAGFVPSNYRGTDGLDARADLGTLNWSDVPAVLLETHNMRDPQEAALFRTPETQGRLADAVVDAIAQVVDRDR